MKVESYHHESQKEAWEMSYRPRRGRCRSGWSPAGRKLGHCSWTLDPGLAHLLRNTEMAVSVESFQFRKKSACWKLSQELYSSIRERITVLCIFLSLVFGVDLRTTNFVRATILYTFCLGVGFQNHSFLRGTGK